MGAEALRRRRRSPGRAPGCAGRARRRRRSRRATSSDATPASTGAQAPLRAAARAPAAASRNARSVGVELGVVLGRPVERGGQPRAAVQAARVARVRLPGARGVARARRCTRRPSASSSSQPRSRGHSRSSASCATSTVPSLTVSSRRSVSRRDDVVVLLVERDPAAHDRAARVLVAQAQQERARGGLLRRVERDEGVLGEARDRALDAAAARVGAQPQPPPVAPVPELQQRRRQQRQRARLASTSASSASASSGSTLSPARCAGRSIARRSSSRDIGPDEHVVGAERARELRVGGAAAVEVRAHDDHHDAAAEPRQRGRRTRRARARRRRR